MEKMPHSAVRCSNMPLPFRRYREAATGCRDQFVVACLGSFVCVAVVVVVVAVASGLISRLIFLCAAGGWRLLLLARATSRGLSPLKI